MIIIRACYVAVLAQADRVPRGQSGNVRGEQVLPVDGDAHLKEGANQDCVCRLATRTVDSGSHNRKIIGRDSICTCKAVVALYTYYTHTIILLCNSMNSRQSGHAFRSPE